MKRVMMLAVALTISGAGAAGAAQRPGTAVPREEPRRERAANDDQRRDDQRRDQGNGRFSPRDQEEIRGYYSSRRNSLPPGLRKKAARGRELPPGWQKRMQPLPIELERRLGPLPRDYRRGIVDGRAVVYNRRSHSVIDVTILF